MRSNCSYCHYCEELVRVKEGLIESMTDGCGTLDYYYQQGDCCGKATLREWIGQENIHDPMKSDGVMVIHEPSDYVDHRLENDDASDPSVKKIEGVEGHGQDRDQWVIPCSEQDEHQHVNDGEVSRAAPQLSDKCCSRLSMIIQYGAVDDITD